MFLVGGQHVRQQRHRHIRPVRRVHQAPQVLGQARTAEGEPRAQIRRADVELAVGQKHLHHPVRVQPQRPADRPQLVSEADLHPVEGVVRVLGHLRDRDRHPKHPTGQTRIQRRHRTVVNRFE